MQYPITTDDAIETLVAERPSTYGAKRTLPDGREFIYAYTALTTLVKGGCVALDFTGGTAAGQNPRATVPATTSVVGYFGINAETVTAAGGIWVQTYGRCAYCKVDGATDVNVGDHVKPTNAAQYLTRSAGDTTRVITDIGVAETEETVAYGSQADTTGDPNNTVFLYGGQATVA